MIKYIFILTFISIVDSKIKFVMELFRHGARAPMNAEKDLFNLTWNGDAELTPLGMRQHFLIGHQFRKKYIDQENFLSSQFNPQEINIFSTDTNRTIMSAYSQLLGLYPPFTGFNLSTEQQKVAIPPMYIDDLKEILQELGNASLPFYTQVLPIHIFDKDNFINIKDNCPEIKRRQDENKDKPVIIDLLNNFYKEYGIKLEILYNQTDIDFHEYDSVARFTDNIISALFDQRDLENIKNIVNIDQLLNYSFLFHNLQQFEVGYGDKHGYSARVSMSSIIRRFYNYIDNIISHDKGFLSLLKGPKLVMYSAHDNNIAEMLVTLNQGLKLNLTYNYIQFASNIIFEFSQNDDTKMYDLEIIYNGKTLFKDSYNSFQNEMNTVLISSEDIITFCELNKSSSLDIYYLITITCLAALCFILIIALIICYFQKKRLGYQEL